MTNHASDDYETLRQNLYEMLEEAKDALEMAKEILRESEHPRAVEVYSGLLNNVVKLNAQILDLSKTHKDITERKTYKDPGADLLPVPTTPEIPQEQAKVFIGNTADLQRMMKQAFEENTVDVTPNDNA